MLKKFYIIICLLLLCACHEEWLDVRQNKVQVVPQTLDDLQALLDNSSVMNLNDGYLGELSTTDLVLNVDWWQKAILVNRNAYLWKPDVYEGEEVLDWNNGYKRIFYANSVLDLLRNHPQSVEKEHIQGSALFYRAFAYYKLAQVFCKPYVAAEADHTGGLPLQLQSNINESVTRASLSDTYDLITSDLAKAITLLPESTPFITQPTAAAAYALYAKTALLMSDYELAESYASKALAIKNDLIDFNLLDPNANYPLQEASEVVFYSQMSTVFPIADYTYYQISPDLINAYAPGDLRKEIYFRADDGSGGFNGSYCGRGFFGGIATDELYLIRAECRARRNQIEETLQDLNTLLKTRFSTEAFVPVSGASAQELLDRVLEERKKELVFRGLHWEDLRRLNASNLWEVTLSRTLDGQTYELPPNDPRYVLPIPDQVIKLSDIDQNPR